MRIVLKLGGNVVLDAAQVAVVARELDALRSNGHAVVLVHGGGPQLDAALTALGETVQRIDGLRVTSPAAAQVVEEVLDAIGTQLTASIARLGVPARHIPTAHKALGAGVKRAGLLGRVGTVESFAAAELGETSPPAPVPVVTPVGFDAKGPLNVNADEGACAVASAWGADWLVLGTDVEAVRGEQGTAIERLDPARAAQLVHAKAATGGMIPKLEAATTALKAGVGTVLITKVGPGSLVRAIVEGKPEGTLVCPVVA